MKVYVVEIGNYEERRIEAIYVSPEAALAAYPVPGADPDPKPYQRKNRGWRASGGVWTNGPGGATITEHQVLRQRPAS